MIFYFDRNGNKNALSSTTEYYIQHEYGGNDTLHITLEINSPEYKKIAEETKIEYKDCYYLVKKISDEEIICNLDFNFLKERFLKDYSSGSVSLTTFLGEFIPAAWTITGASSVTARRTIDIEFGTPYDAIIKSMDEFNVAYRWHTKTKELEVIIPSDIEPTGEYITTELNLKSLSFSGQTSDFITRLYPYGKDKLNIASVNSGLEYIENHAYSNETIIGYWSDERYTVAQDLKDAAIEKLATLSFPIRSYECDIMDFAKASSDYDYLEIALYKLVILLDPEKGTRTNHRVVSYTEYPNQPEKNKVTLSTVSEKITTKIEKVQNSVNINNEVVNSKINIVKQEADQNTALLAQVYTKGETDTQISSLVQQAVSAIRTELSAQYVTDTTVREYISQIEQTINGIDLKTSVRGGYNLLYGSAAYDLESFETVGNVEAVRNVSSVSDYMESGGAFLIGSGTASELQQTVKTVPGGMYCWMIRYKLTGAVTGAASITIQNAETALSATDDWTLVQGQFTANSPDTTLNIKNTNGYLYVGDLVIIAGSEINAWQQAQNEIITNGMSFANGKLKINGNENDLLETEMTNSAVRVVDSATGDIMWRISVGGVELDQTVIHKKLTVEPETGSKAFAVVPQGDGHIYFVIND